MKTQNSLALSLSFLIISCSSPDTLLSRTPAGNSEEVLEDAVVRTLPQLSSSQAKQEFEDDILKKLKSQDLPEQEKSLMAENIASYMAFLQADINDKNRTEITSRLLNSSTQFAACKSFDDWACLEKYPIIKPKMEWRQETSQDLGKVVKLKKPLSMEFFFTQQWDAPSVDLSKTMANTLAEKIKKDATKGLYMALYGIDDHEKSMKPVFDAIVEKVTKKVDVKAIFDTEEIVKGKGTQVFSYIKPKSGEWIFDKLPTQNPKEPVPQTYVAWQYKSTPLLLEKMNAGAKKDADTKARIEYPNQKIMHNKFFVMKGASSSAVWTGSTNVARTCMGEERNSNVAVYIKNPEIVESFEKEFQEMFNFMEKAEDKRFVNAEGKANLSLGAFHNNKKPNTARYFQDSEGTEIKVHFSPTDDGEHRLILPMLLSAKEGDIIRLTMFGAGGYESMRALQYAAAKGADVRIILDNYSGTGPGSWFKDSDVQYDSPNPYLKLVERKGSPGKITLLRSNWKGLNHHKSGSLSRNLGNGKFRHEVVIVGSQNWTGSGNDDNDENMIGIRNLKKSVPLAEAYVDHYDNRLWAKALKGKPAKE